MSASTKTVPIGGGNDPYYRYQMEAVVCETRRRNKTAIVNLPQIATRDLHRSPKEVIKYIGQSLSSCGSHCTKTGDYLINGIHSQQAVQDKVQEYCKDFVICGMCRNPETEYRLKRDAILLECKACGGHTEVNEELKLYKYIVAQQKELKKRQKKANKEKKEALSTKKHKDTDPSSDRKKKAVKKKKRTAQANKSTPAFGYYDEHFDNPYFSTKGNPLYVGHFDRIAKASKQDEEAVLDHAVGAVRSFLRSNPDASADECVQAITKAQESTVLFSHERLRIFAKAVQCSDVMEYKDVLVQLVDDSMESYLIAVMEEACADQPKLFARILVQLYEGDIVREETLLEWAYEKPSSDCFVSKEVKAGLRDSMKHVISWLEEENSNDEEG